MVAAASKELVIIADMSKEVKQLGRFPLPVEVIPFGWKQVQSHIRKQYNVSSKLRMKDGQPLVTDHGHYILDARFGQITDPAVLHTALNIIPGVVDNGLFINLATSTIIGDAAGVIISSQFL